MERTDWTDEELEACEGKGISGLPRGLYARFLELLTPEQKKVFKPIAAIIRRQKREEQQAQVLAANAPPREQLHDAISQAQGKITADDIERLIDAAVEKGDIGALRTLAQMGGIDLTRRPVSEVGPGARLVIVRPTSRPLLDLTADQQATVRLGIKVAGS